MNGEGERVNSGKPSQAAIGRALGLSPAAMTKLKGQGMPVDSVEAAQAWREARQNLAARKALPPAAPPVPPAAQLPYTPPTFPPLSEPPDEDRDAARTRREISEANMARMAELKMAHELIRVDAVQRQLSTDYATTRDALLQIPARLAPLVAAETNAATIQSLLHAEIHQALTNLAGTVDAVPNIEGGFE